MHTVKGVVVSSIQFFLPHYDYSDMISEVVELLRITASTGIMEKVFYRVMECCISYKRFVVGLSQVSDGFNVLEQVLMCFTGI